MHAPKTPRRAPGNPAQRSPPLDGIDAGRIGASGVSDGVSRVAGPGFARVLGHALAQGAVPGSGPCTRARCRARFWAMHSRECRNRAHGEHARRACAGGGAWTTRSNRRGRVDALRSRGQRGSSRRQAAARTDEITGARTCVGRSQIVDRAVQAGRRGCRHANTAILGTGQAAQGRTPACSAVGSRRGGVPVRGGAFPRVARSALDLGGVPLRPRFRRAAAAGLLPVQAQRRHDARPPDARGLERAGCLQPDHASEPLRRRGHLCQE